MDPIPYERHLGIIHRKLLKKIIYKNANKILHDFNAVFHKTILQFLKHH